MVIISKSTLNKFGEGHPESKEALFNWYLKVKGDNSSTFHELKTTFNSIDAVGKNRYVFNIKGNKYRLIALIIFETRTLFILFIGTHEQYNKIEASKIEYKKL
jgi:mRNA interferase HigB